MAPSNDPVPAHVWLSAAAAITTVTVRAVVTLPFIWARRKLRGA